MSAHSPFKASISNADGPFMEQTATIEYDVNSVTEDFQRFNLKNDRNPNRDQWIDIYCQ